MNRENKRKLYDKHYYKTHPCDEAFTCKHCGRLVVPEGAGSDHRNHCPYCLCSAHLDNAPGDREADCGALMEPIGVWVRKNGEWALLHRCRMCGTIHANRVAADDNPLLLMSLASKPLACPPFPLDKLEEMAALCGVILLGAFAYFLFSLADRTEDVNGRIASLHDVATPVLIERNTPPPVSKPPEITSTRLERIRTIQIENRQGLAKKF